MILIISIMVAAAGLTFFWLGHKKKVQTDEHNRRLENERARLEALIQGLKKEEEQKQNQINYLNEVAKNMGETSKNSFEKYCDTLDQLYLVKEADYDNLLNLLQRSYEGKQAELLADLGKAHTELDKIMRTRAAALEAQRQEEEIKNKITFYCPQIAEMDLKDAKVLREVEPKLINPRILRMLIWTTFYQKPINQVCANVLGGAAVVKMGIYKITNQQNNICYIGQARDVATRWKMHAKCGLGIDAPAGNKLYKAMQQDGLENFSFELLEECKGEELNEKERFYIKLYQANEFGYNSSAGVK